MLERKDFSLTPLILPSGGWVGLTPDVFSQLASNVGDAQNKTHPQRFIDTNHSRTVTFGELAGYVRQKVAWAAKTQFNQDQRPLLLPPLKPDDAAASLVLTALPSLSSSEAP